MKAVLIPLTIVLLPAFLQGSEWPQFRGPSGDGVAFSGKAPLIWSDTENVDWKVELPGKGWSSPVEADGKLWLTTAVESIPSKEEREQLLTKSGTDPKHFGIRQIAKEIALKLVAVDLKTGELAKTVELFTVKEPDAIHSLNSYASPTPVVDEGHIYCHFGTFGTCCYSLEKGEISWKRTLPLEHAVGPGSSPFIQGNVLILTCDGCDRQYVTGLNKLTGDTIWERDRPKMDAPDGDRKKSFSTPVAAVDENGREQAICMGSQWIVSYAPETGEELWKVYHGTGFSVVPRPVVGHGMVYFSTGFAKAQLWAIRIDGDGDVTDTHVVWTEKRGIPTMPSPLLVGDEIYVISDAGIASCFNAHDGTSLWVERVGGNYSASPLYADGKIFFSSHEGKVTVIAPGREYEQLSINQLDGQIMASPILIQNALYFRTEQALYRIPAES